ncbi:MAG: 50S ribosomal protein L28 [Bacteroidetes bacterium]|nr:50S ribosomal protein L28 [Bacteroidota bacterium]
MARICDLTGKKAMTGNSVSFSNKKTKRKFNPNLQTKKFFVPELGEWITLKVSTSALRTIDKLGISAAIEKSYSQRNNLILLR